MIDSENRPKHYSMDHEPIKVFKAWATNSDEYIGFCKFSVLKYLSRIGKKDGETQISDARKARDYLNWMIEALEEREKTN